MGTLTLALRTAQSGLLVNQQALDVTSRNITNVNTEGYSRKIVGFENSAVAGAGVGVNIAEIVRNVNQGLLKSTRIELSKLNELSAQSSYWDRMQDLFGTPEANSSLSHILESFGESIESLAVSPNKSLEQTEVVRQAQNVTLSLQDMTRIIQELRLQVDQQMTQIATEMNRLVQEIDKLNDDIVASSSVKLETSDLKDQRDLKLTRLAELVDIRYFERADGDVVVFTSGGRTLVDTEPPTISHSAAAAVTPTSTHAEGNFSGFFIGSTTVAGNDATTSIRDGQLKGLIDLRDVTLPNLQSQLDDLAATMRDVINQVHNRGTSFPGLQDYSGTRAFTEPATQIIKLDPTNSSDDVAITLFDDSGNQSQTTTLNTIMQANGLTSRGTGNDWTINKVSANLQSWLRNNGAATASVSVSTGKMVINLNSTTLNLAFRDQTATDPSLSATTQDDAVIAFDSNADGTVDETVKGFSNFFGLNDFFVDNLAENTWESNVLASGYTTTAATITFRDANGLIGTTLPVAAGSTLSDIVTQIANDGTLSGTIKASVIPDGSGYRLRIAHNSGSSFQITQAAGNTLLTDIGINIADARVASTLTVRSDILLTPAKVSTGVAQWDSSLGTNGQFIRSVGDDTIAKAWSETMTGTTSFKTAGGLPNVSLRFSERAAAILSANATLAAQNAQNTKAQTALTESLQRKFEGERGVNLDEEMSNLIIFEQAYGASARLITVIQRMFDALERAI